MLTEQQEQDTKFKLNDFFRQEKIQKNLIEYGNYTHVFAPYQYAVVIPDCLERHMVSEPGTQMFHATGMFIEQIVREFGKGVNEDKQTPNYVEDLLVAKLQEKADFYENHDQEKHSAIKYLLRSSHAMLLEKEGVEPKKQLIAFYEEGNDKYLNELSALASNDSETAFYICDRFDSQWFKGEKKHDIRNLVEIMGIMGCTENSETVNNSLHHVIQQIFSDKKPLESEQKQAYPIYQTSKARSIEALTAFVPYSLPEGRSQNLEYIRKFTQEILDKCNTTDPSVDHFIDLKALMGFWTAAVKEDPENSSVNAFNLGLQTAILETKGERQKTCSDAIKLQQNARTVIKAASPGVGIHFLAASFNENSFDMTGRLRWQYENYQKILGL